MNQSEIAEARKKIIRSVTKLEDSYCASCTKVSKHGLAADKRICGACPVGKLLSSYGKQLDELAIERRKDKYGDEWTSIMHGRENK